MSVGQPISGGSPFPPPLSPPGPNGPVGLTGPMAQAAQAKAAPPPPDGLEIGIEMLKRLEPDLTPLSMEVMVCSIAVSLRGIHNDLSSIRNAVEQGNYGQRDSLSKIGDAINSIASNGTAVRAAIDQLAKAKREAIQQELSRMPY